MATDTASRTQSYAEQTQRERDLIKENAIAMFQGLDEGEYLPARNALTAILCERLNVKDLDVDLANAISDFESALTYPIAKFAYRTLFRNVPELYMGDEEQKAYRKD